MLVISDRLQIPLKELSFSFARSSGPGGQNVNKVNSKATLRWNALETTSLPADVRERFLGRFGPRLTQAGEVVVVSQRYRDQGRNVADCLAKLRAMLSEVAEPPTRRRPTRPTRASGRRRLEDKRAASRRKEFRRKPGLEG